MSAATKRRAGPDGEPQREPAASAGLHEGPRPGRAQALRLGALQAAIDRSPRMRAQRRAIDAAFGPTRARPSAASPVVQRRMGMELETGVPARNNMDQTLFYKTLIYRAPGAIWQVHADGSNLEFVTDPVSDRGALLGAIGEMTAFIRAAKDLMATSQSPDDRIAIKEKVKGSKESLVEWVNYVRVGDVADRVGVNIKGTDMAKIKIGNYNSSFAARPQVTFGIPMERMYELLVAASTPKPAVKYRNSLRPGGSLSKTYPQESLPIVSQGKGPDHIDWAGAGTRLAQSLLAQGVRGVDNARVVGLTSLVLRTINDLLLTYQSRAEPEYVKSEFTLLHRSDFHAMYIALGDARKWFTVDGVIAASSSAPADFDYPVFKHGLPNYVGDVLKPTNRVPTIRQWLQSIITPREWPAPSQHGGVSKADVARADQKLGVVLSNKDLLSKGFLRHNSYSMGELDADTADPRMVAPLHLLEMRNLVGGGKASQVSVDKWPDLAGELFDFYDAWVIAPQRRQEKRGADERARARDEAYNAYMAQRNNSDEPEF